MNTLLPIMGANNVPSLTEPTAYLQERVERYDRMEDEIGRKMLRTPDHKADLHKEVKEIYSDHYSFKHFIVDELRAMTLLLLNMTLTCLTGITGNISNKDSNPKAA